MNADGLFTDELVNALTRDEDAYRPAPPRQRLGFWRALVSALRRDTPAFTGRPSTPR